MEAIGPINRDNLKFWKTGITVETDIPIPPEKEVVGWPHATMEVGQSFFIASRTMVSVCNANQRYKKRLGWEFTSRKVEGGIRTWRTK